MIAHHICELSIVKAAQICTDLVRLKGLVEIEGNLGSDLREHCRVHTGLASLLEEEVLGLSQA